MSSAILKKAFNSVHRKSLVEIPRPGNSDKDYIGYKNAVKCIGNMSKILPVNSGVRLDSVLVCLSPLAWTT